MIMANAEPGTADRRQVAPLRALALMVGFGAVVNLATLMAPLYLLVLYDQVLPAQDHAGLVALLVLAIGVYAIMGGLDAARLRISARLGAGLADDIQRRLAGTPGRSPPEGSDPLPDQCGRLLTAAEALCRPLAGPAGAAALDLLWTPLFVLAVFVVHPVLGWIALVGGAALLGATLLAQRGGAWATGPLADATERAARSRARIRLAPQGGASTDDTVALQSARTDVTALSLRAAETTATALAVGRSARLILHAGLLAAGAGLTMRGEIGTGAMLAVAILAMRALAPLDILAMQAGQIAAARDGWRTLRACPGLLPGHGRATALRDVPPWLEPDLAEGLEIADAAVVPPGAGGPVLQRIALRVLPGEVVGVTGPPGAGKSTLAALAAGLMAPTAGCVLLGGVPLARIDPARRAHLVGFLPQRVAVAPGSVIANVALARPAASRSEVGCALRRAGLPDALARLPEGAATRLSADGAPLPASAVERVGLARAVLGHPALVILDCPLPASGPSGAAFTTDLARSLARGGAMVLLITPAPEALANCDRLLVLDRGLPVMAGPTRQVIAALSAGCGAADLPDGSAGWKP